MLSLLFVLLLCTSFVHAEVSAADKTSIQSRVTMIANSINNNDIQYILNMVSPNARSTLKSEIEENIAGKMIKFQQSISSYEDLGNNQVKVKGTYVAAGSGWNVNGMSNYYIFERSGNSWKLVDTNFHQKMGAGYVFKSVGKIFAIIIPLLIILGIFWLWMLIDAIKRQFESKTLWIILIIVLGFLGAILYFFIIRRKLKQQGNFGNQQPQQQYNQQRRQ
jgi:preprotein translocase subunit YajC